MSAKDPLPKPEGGFVTVDYSDSAITQRNRQVPQLLMLCFSLMKAKRENMRTRQTALLAHPAAKTANLVNRRPTGGRLIS